MRQRTSRRRNSSQHILTVLLAALCLCSFICHAQEILLLRGPQVPASEQKQWEDTAAFLGLTLRTVDLTSSTIQPKVRGDGSPRVIAILVSADTLPIAKRALHALLGHGNTPPLLVFGVRPDTNTPQLLEWSHGALRGCAPNESSAATRIRFASDHLLLGALAGTDLKAVGVPACSMIMEPGGHEVVIESGLPAKRNPVLVKVRTAGSEIFFAPALHNVDSSWLGKPDSLEEAFSSLAVPLVFAMHAAGPYAWHLNEHDANLTIDDPWLREPYGNLSYSRLLEQMKVHHFHTTIAFVPWNYDRSYPVVAQTVRDNPAFFSISLHGNNHLHREFADYSKVPLKTQVSDMQQGITRMDAFSRLTGIGYDRVMVFPHGVAPRLTFDALRRTGFLGTANSINVPLGEPFPEDPFFLLRPYTTRYAGLLSLSRLSLEAPIPDADLPVLTFLGAPMLFYGHQQLFADGGRHALEIIDRVNGLDPGIRWTSLADLAKNLYQIRQTSKDTFDVRVLSSQALIRNSSHETSTFRIWLPDRPAKTISDIRVDGKLLPQDLGKTDEITSVVLPPGGQSLVEVTYQDRLSIPLDQSLGHAGLSVYAVRRLSDFRDLWLSTHPVGRIVTAFYYEHHLGGSGTRGERVLLPGSIAILLLLIFYFARRFARSLKTNHETRQSTEVLP